MEKTKTGEEWVEQSEYDVTRVPCWVAPSRQDDGAKILTMPNVPQPLHGVNPRSIMGESTWNHVRKRCYYEAGYKCEACGRELGKGECQAHELYTYNYVTGTARFERCVCLCRTCHVGGIHSGRALTMYKRGNPIMPKTKILEGAENLFRVLYEYNLSHPKDSPLRAYSTFIDYAKWPDLHDEMEALIKKYDVKFYGENPWLAAKWGDWKLIVGNKTYPTPYKDQAEWAAAMEKNDMTNQNVAVPAKPKSELDLEIEKILSIDEQG